MFLQVTRCFCSFQEPWRMHHPEGSQVCGQRHGSWNEQKHRVTCKNINAHGTVNLDIWSSINQHSHDEAWGIDNVILEKQDGMFRYTQNFESGEDGWSCNGITTCGHWGKICGGFGRRAA